jgi:hypothetical protein
MSTKKLFSVADFKRHFYLVVVVLAGLCLLLLVLNLLQGPRLRRGEVDRSLATRQPNQRLILYANQPIASINASQITVEPKVDFTASANGEAPVIQFRQRLLYGTTYRVTVHNVVNAYRTHKKTDFAYSFRTAEPTFYYVHRNYGLDPNNSLTGKQPDEIKQASLGDEGEAVLFSAPQIQDYVVLGNNLVVATINEDKTNSLYLVNTKTKKSEALTLPAAGTLTDLHASPNQRLVGFSFTSNESDYTKRKFDNVLFNIDLAAGRLVYPVKGFNGQNLQVMNWEFAPDGMTILAQLYDTSLLLVDTGGKNAPLPLGQFSSFDNFSYNGAKIAVEDMTDISILDILKHEKTSITNQSIGGREPFTAKVRLLANGEGHMKQVEILSSDSKVFTEYVIVDRQGSQKTIYQADAYKTNINSMATSPNDQYAMIEVTSIKEDSTSDLYQSNTKSRNAHTLIIDMNSGKTVQDVNGFGISWQQ